MELHLYLFIFIFFSTTSLVYSQSNATSPYSALKTTAPSTYSGFFESLFPFYVGCKWFYNSLLSADGLNQNLIIST